MTDKLIRTLAEQISDRTKQEFQMIVVGWKMSGISPDYRRREFREHSRLYVNSIAEAEASRDVASQRNRIGQTVDDWQPHITEVIVEMREVTQWQTLSSRP